MINKKILKSNLFIALMIILTFVFSACGKNDTDNIKEGETFEETTTLSYEESVAESIEKESIRRESSKAHKESVKESKRVIEESVVESVKEVQQNVDDIRKADEEFNSTREAYINSIKQKYDKEAIEEIIKAQRESELNKEGENEN